MSVELALREERIKTESITDTKAQIHVVFKTSENKMDIYSEY